MFHALLLQQTKRLFQIFSLGKRNQDLCTAAKSGFNNILVSKETCRVSWPKNEKSMLQTEWSQLSESQRYADSGQSSAKLNLALMFGTNATKLTPDQISIQLKDFRWDNSSMVSSALKSPQREVAEMTEDFRKRMNDCRKIQIWAFSGLSNKCRQQQQSLFLCKGQSNWLIAAVSVSFLFKSWSRSHVFP